MWLNFFTLTHNTLTWANTLSQNVVMFKGTASELSIDWICCWCRRCYAKLILFVLTPITLTLRFEIPIACFYCILNKWICCLQSVSYRILSPSFFALHWKIKDIFQDLEVTGYTSFIVDKNRNTFLFDFFFF